MRVGEQLWGKRRFTPGYALHPLETSDHTLRAKAGSEKMLHGCLIGLPFEFPAIGEESGLLRGLGSQHDRTRSLFRPHHPKQDRCGNSCDGLHLDRSLSRKGLRDVTARHMGDFMGQYPGKLFFRLYLLNKTTIEKDGRYRADTSSGQITFRIPETSSCMLELETSGGRIRAKLPMVIETVSRTRLRGTMGAGEAQINLSTSGGNIYLLPFD